MTRRKTYRILSLLLALFLCYSATIPVYATENKNDEKKITIKVAFYQLDGFFEYDKDGNECGYGVDYLNELSRYANIEWEYVKAESWEGIRDMMKNGQVDIRMPVTMTSTPSETYDYTTESVLTTYHSIMTLKERTDLFYHDYDKLYQLKIGIVGNQFEGTTIGNYFQSIGIMDNLISYEDYNSCKAALEAGQIDALISNVMDLTDDMKILDKFLVVNNGIITLKGNPCYTIVNNAMTELKLENPSFLSQLYERYYPERANEPFTKEEYEYAQRTSPLTVAVHTDRKPVSYLDDDGNYRGIAIDFANLISKKIGIPFEYVSVTTSRTIDMLDTVDLVMPMPKFMENENYFVTNSFLDTDIILAVRNGNTELSESATVGTLDSTTGIYHTLERLSKFNFITYSTNREALNALQRGEIDAYANTSYIINWNLGNPRYEDLSALHYKSFPIEYSICGHSEDTVLHSLLNKGIRAISEDEKEVIIQNGSKLSMDDFNVWDHLYIYRAQIFTALIGILLFLVAIFVYNHKRTVYINKIKESSRKQEEANQAKTEFLARMSHDMRTPLNVIMGMTHLASENNNPEDTNNCLNKIYISSEFLLGLINDVLDLEHMESGKMTLHLVPYSVKEFNQYINAVIKPLCDQKNLQFEYIYEGPDDFVVMLDKLRINQVYFNLLSNSVKFTQEGGKITFHCHFTKTDHQTILMDVKISDTGIGMKPEFMKEMFQPFTQENQELKPVGEGIGLGLSIVKKICDMMGMTISVDSEQGIGTTFTLHGECEIATETLMCTDQMEKKEENLKDYVFENKTFLVCEDHQMNQEIICRLLEKRGAVVVLADNGKRGLHSFEQSAPGFFDAILMDIRMPVMDGLQTTQAIRALQRVDAATVPIIALTANAYDEDIEKCVEAGMNAHLSKPINPQMMFQTIYENLK